MPQVQVSNLSVDFGAVRAVDNVSFGVEDGTMVGFLGPSGCGKSTLLRTIAGLTAATSGRISIGDVDLFNSEKNISVLPEKRELGMVFQSYAIWPHMTVEENIAFPLKIRNVRKDAIAERTARVLKIVNMESLGKRPATDLSGGQQQRLAIARSLVFEPRVLLFDEPLSNVDAKLRQQMGHELRSIQQETGVTAIYVTHDQSEALSMCDKIVVLKLGKVQQVGAPQEIYEHPTNSFVGDFIGSASILDAVVVQGNEAGADAEVTVLVGDKFPMSVKSARHTLTAGQKVRVLVRPEDVTISQRRGAVEAVIENASYLGDRWYCTAAFGGERVKLYSTKASRLHIGDKVKLDVVPSTVFVE
jgi:iron(III) transport system ATP-binding protein